MTNAFDLAKHAVLVSFNAYRPKLTAVDKRLTEEQKASHGVTGRKTLKTVKDFYGEELDVLNAAINAARTDHYRLTLRWVIEGAQVLPSAMYVDYARTMREHKDHVEDLVRRFDYDAMLARRAAALNGTFNRGDYPSEAQFKASFGFDLSTMPIPSTETLSALNGMVMQDVQALMAEHNSRMQDATAEAMKSAWKKLYDVLARVTENLSDGKCGRINDSLIGNIVDLCDILPKLNVAGDQRLEDLRREVEAKLCTISTESLKKNEHGQKDAAKKAQEIIDKMGAYMGAWGEA